ncbi:MAG: hypothetical protein ACRDPY_01050 [Streptosporangiaceae bacterium]
MTPSAFLDEAQRERLAALADALMPGLGMLPSPSEVGTHLEGLDRLLAVRPDLLAVLRAAADIPGGGAEYLAALRAGEPDTLESLTFALAGAYLTTPQVRRALGYPGIAPRRAPAAPDEADYYLDDGVLEPVRSRGPIYRPTPQPAGEPQPGAGRPTQKGHGQ